MIIGVPKEIKNHEERVGAVPSGVHSLTRHGHRVLIEKSAGIGSGYQDSDYVAAGAEIVASAEAVYGQAEMILKVKEPLAPEYDLLRPGQILFTYLHLAPDPDQAKALLDHKVSAIAYETVQKDNGALPLLSPMSEIAGRMAAQIGAWLLQKNNGGRGVLLGGVAGVPPAEVLIVGGGVVGTNAARVASGMGARVLVADVDINVLHRIRDQFNGEVATLLSNEFDLAEHLTRADLLIGAVLVPGARAPRVVSAEMVSRMKPGSVIVDVAIDQGGSVETVDRMTSHDEPYYVRHGVVHYSVPNMPGAVARTSTLALTGATLPYCLKIANQGLKEALTSDVALLRGLNTYDGHMTCRSAAEGLGLPYVDPMSLL